MEIDISVTTVVGTVIIFCFNPSTNPIMWLLIPMQNYIGFPNWKTIERYFFFKTNQVTSTKTQNLSTIIHIHIVFLYLLFDPSRYRDPQKKLDA